MLMCEIRFLYLTQVNRNMKCADCGIACHSGCEGNVASSHCGTLSSVRVQSRYMVRID